MAVVKPKRARFVRLRIPDDDTAERTVAYVAKQLWDGQELIVLDYNPVIPVEQMAPLVRHLTSLVRTAEASSLLHTRATAT
jgi:hypothetical protein